MFVGLNSHQISWSVAHSSREGSGSGKKMFEHGVFQDVHVYRARDLGKEYLSDGFEAYMELRAGIYNETIKSVAILNGNCPLCTQT